MKVSATPVRRLVLAAGAISAVFLLLSAACAQGETIDGAVTPLTSAAEDAASIEQAPAPAPPAEAPAPVEVPEPESVIEATGATAAGAVKTASEAIESNPAASTVSAASETVREGTSETVRRATGEVEQVVTETAAAVDDRTRRLSGLSEKAGAKVETAVAGLGNPSRPARQARPASTTPSGLLPSPGGNPVFERPASLDEAPHTHGAVQPVGLLPRVHAGGVSSSSAGYPGFSGAGPSWLTALGPDGAQSTPVGRTTGAGSNDPAPLDGPAPVFGSSPATAGGSTGSFFVPLAALLALLALVAPATLRRLGEVPASRPPVPFVCALERPG